MQGLFVKQLFRIAEFSPIPMGPGKGGSPLLFLFPHRTVKPNWSQIKYLVIWDDDMPINLVCAR